MTVVLQYCRSVGVSLRRQQEQYQVFPVVVSVATNDETAHLAVNSLSRLACNVQIYRPKTLRIHRKHVPHEIILPG